MRCGVYVRVSTDNQRDNGYSIDSQLQTIKEYCEKKQLCYCRCIQRCRTLWKRFNATRNAKINKKFYEVFNQLQLEENIKQRIFF